MSNAASLNPETFTEGGGLVDDVDATVKSAMFDMFDYNGKVVPGVPSLKLDLDVEDMDEVTQYYSMGSNKDWMPSDDGKQLLSVGNASGIRMSSNGGIFIKSLIDAGFPADKLGDDISILDGMQAHFIRVPAPERKGLKKNADKKFEETILIVSEITTLPWEKSKPKGAPSKGKAKSKSSSGKAKGAPKEEVTDDDVSSSLMGIITDLLLESGSLTKKELPGKLFKAAKDHPARNEMVKMAFDDDFLSSGPWEYEDGTLVMG